MFVGTASRRLAGVLVLLLAGAANASDITWGGNYRVEAVKITNPELSSANSNKAYLLHHLVLSPKIQAADGVTIFSRVDVFNNPTWGIDPTTGAVYSVAGDTIGGGPNPSTSAAPPANGSSNTMTRTQKASSFALTQLYATWSQEFGQFIVGRAPLQFGLGSNWNAGNGLFDHYIDTRDMVGYKVVIGNFYMLPILGKVNEGVLGEEDDVNDYMLHMQYDNPETDLSLGLLYQMRVYTYAGNDTPLSGTIGGATPVRADGGKITTYGLFMRQNAGNFRIGVEADMVGGDTGLKTAAAGQNVSMNSFGIAGEIEYKPENAKTTAMFKLGMATGDDPGTTESYEGFQFSRNYDVAMLLFNHPLGQADILRTGLVRPSTAVNSQIDSEALSNAVYFAPSFQTQWKENFSYGATLAYAILNKEPIGAAANTATSLGWELDLNLTYKPYERLTWITEAGFLMPGDAWKAGTTNNFETKFAYGLVTKAAITF